MILKSQVYLDITIDDVDIGRIVIGLFGEIVPKTVWNFRSLANGIKVKERAFRHEDS